VTAEGCFLVSARTLNLVDPDFVRIVIIITLMFLEYLICMYPAVLFVARQAPLSLGFPRQETWSELPFPFSGGSSQPRD